MLDSCDEIGEANPPVLHALDVAFCLCSTHYHRGTGRSLWHANVEGMRVFPGGRLELGAKNLGIDGGVLGVQVLGHKDLAGRDTRGTARVSRLLLVLTWDPVFSRSIIMAEESHVDPAVGKKGLAGRLFPLGELWSCDLPLDLHPVSLFAGSRNRLAESDTKTGIFIWSPGQSLVDRSHRFLGGVGCVGDCKVYQSRGFRTPESHRQIPIVQRRWRVVPVEEQTTLTDLVCS